MKGAKGDPGVMGPKVQKPRTYWTCKICGRTGFPKRMAHGCLNTYADWKKVVGVKSAGRFLERPRKAPKAQGRVERVRGRCGGPRLPAKCRGCQYYDPGAEAYACGVCPVTLKRDAAMENKAAPPRPSAVACIRGVLVNDADLMLRAANCLPEFFKPLGQSLKNRARELLDQAGR